MLFAKNYNNVFEFVKVIIQNIVNPDTVRAAFWMTSHLRQHYVVICQFVSNFSNILVKWSLRVILTINYENIFKFVKVTHRIS